MNNNNQIIADTHPLRAIDNSLFAIKEELRLHSDPQEIMHLIEVTRSFIGQICTSLEIQQRDLDLLKELVIKRIQENG